MTIRKTHPTLVWPFCNKLLPITHVSIPFQVQKTNLQTVSDAFIQSVAPLFIYIVRGRLKWTLNRTHDSITIIREDCTREGNDQLQARISLFNRNWRHERFLASENQVNWYFHVYEKFYLSTSTWFVCWKFWRCIRRYCRSI